MRYVTYFWRVVVGLIYLAVVIGVFSVATTRFETLVFAGMVQMYSAVLYNFSVIGVATDMNNYAGFIRFRILATAQGITENEDGTFLEQEEALAERLKSATVPIRIRHFANGDVSLCALFEIVRAVFFM